MWHSARTAAGWRSPAAISLVVILMFEVHDAATGKKLSAIPPLDEPAYSPSFSPDGTSVMATVGSCDFASIRRTR